ncbi:enoyl-CoA hydratase/isomerase family protein [Aquihabitans sp. G128]|uniref:enoyl-CoA hydratase/isomerase family protein n=1 Tax=Aquihabitans sp. G128 TaxID=2849779 RepID=UPI001C2289BA|nr:enoyl-CoA hydratase-related protein [Aquihabitans sp. G128]QXC62615.1 enoyl-CoA hydratase/isomerase family protein [Aquihabitans sp. G128]
MAATNAQPADTEHLRTELVDGVATVTLVNPRRKNAINDVMWGQLTAAFGWVAADAAVRAVVVTGEGTDFCAGADLGEAPERHWLAHMRYVNQACLALHAVPQPTLARIDGVAVGAGLNLALACDLVVASDRSRFSEIFAKRGLSLDFGGSWFLPRRAGLHKAKELALLAPIIDGAEAERIGLVNRVVPVAELDALVEDWARQLAAGPPIALAQSKALLDRSSTSTLAEALAAEAAAQSVNFGTGDTAEAIAAFIQKREPRYTGR